MSKTLLEICEPFFQEVCALLRTAEDGKVGFGAARNRLKECLEALRGEVEAAPGSVQNDFFGIEQDNRSRPGIQRALLFMADDVIEHSVLQFAAQWGQDPLARELGGYVNGKTQFYLDLDAVLMEPADAARARLSVYYTCLCLGFAGLHRENSREITDRAERLYGLLGDMIDRDASRPVCPDAYKVDETVLYRPVRESVVAIGVVLATLVVATLSAYYFLYRSGSAELNDILGEITRSATTNAAPARPPGG